MNHKLFLIRFYHFFIILLSLVFFVSCNFAPQTKINDIQIIQTVTIPSPTNEVIITKPSFITQPIATEAASLTTLPTPTTLSLNSPTPIIECSNNKQKVSLEEVSLQDSIIEVNNSIMYLAIEGNIGMFDISDVINPKLLGFWQLPFLSKISLLKIHNGVAYITDNSATLYLLNLSTECWLDTIMAIDFPFNISDIEIENNIVYIGGYIENEAKLHISIYSIDYGEPKEIGSIVLEEPALWSIYDEVIYLFKEDNLFFADVSEPTSIKIQPINVTLDSQILSRSWPMLVGNMFYMFSDADGFIVVSNLQSNQPVTKYNSNQYILTGIFQVQKDYIFLGDLGCEGGENICSSTVTILSSVDGKQLSSFTFHPHGNIYHYKQIQTDIFYAFSENSLFIVSLSNIKKPIIVNEVFLSN